MVPPTFVPRLLPNNFLPRPKLHPPSQWLSDAQWEVSNLPYLSSTEPRRDRGEKQDVIVSRGRGSRQLLLEIKRQPNKSCARTSRD